MSKNEHHLYIDGQAVRVSEEIYREYKRAEDKERYFMKRLKKGRFVVDEDSQTVTYVPSREASYEQLLEADRSFASPEETMEDAMVRAYIMETLKTALQSLTDEELDLIREIFYQEKTEREVSAAYNVTQTAIHKRKKKILEKLRKFFE